MAVDWSVLTYHAGEVGKVYGSTLPVFVPTPDLDAWRGENVYRFTHRPGPVFDEAVWTGRDAMFNGIAYTSVIHAALQVALYMGFDEALCVGLDHTGGGEHFYGVQERGGEPDKWEAGYQMILDAYQRRGKRIINLSEPTAVKCLPRDDWRKYIR